jgi:hypothetical protein
LEDYQREAEEKNVKGYSATDIHTGAVGVRPSVWKGWAAVDTSDAENEEEPSESTPPAATTASLPPATTESPTGVDTAPKPQPGVSGAEGAGAALRFIGRTVNKEFGGVDFDGTVIAHDRSDGASGSEDWWKVEYSDGDKEDYTLSELLLILKPVPTALYNAAAAVDGVVAMQNNQDLTKENIADVVADFLDSDDDQEDTDATESPDQTDLRVQGAPPSLEAPVPSAVPASTRTDNQPPLQDAPTAAIADFDSTGQLPPVNNTTPTTTGMDVRDDPLPKSRLSTPAPPTGSTPLVASAQPATTKIDSIFEKAFATAPNTAPPTSSDDTLPAASDPSIESAPFSPLTTTAPLLFLDASTASLDSVGFGTSTSTVAPGASAASVILSAAPGASAASVLLSAAPVVGETPSAQPPTIDAVAPKRGITVLEELAPISLSASRARVVVQPESSGSDTESEDNY